MQGLVHWLPGAAVDVARLAVWLVLLLAIFVPLERFAGLRPSPVLRREFFNDVGYFFLGGLLPKVLLILPVAALAWALHFVVPDKVGIFTATLGFWPRLAAAMVVGEVGFYWGHRWTHEIPFLWRFHAVHHSAEHMDWLVNTRAHPVDLVFTRLCGFVPLYVFGLAGPMTGAHVDMVPILVGLASAMWGHFIHANLRWRLGWLEQIVSTPAFHHWHHTNDAMRDRNYASMMPWMDRIFGTFHMPAKAWPTAYGIDAKLAPGLAGQLLDPMLPPRTPHPPAPLGGADLTAPAEPI
jgi:sterol desaturase/sphingolipid hydroxylase (fatty acid hydroxylase superfamily)